MKKTIFTMLLPAVCIMAGCKGQTNSNNSKKDTAMIANIEKFDFDDYKKRLAKDPLGDTYTKEDGTKIQLIGPPGTIAIRETPPPPKFYEIYKEFYDNGNIKKRGAMIINGGVKVGKWAYYDSEGRKTVVDEDQKFGKFGYDDVFKFMEKEGHINLKTGQGRENLSIGFNDGGSGTKTWTAEYWDITHGTFYQYVINGDTGEVISRRSGEIVD